ncbi:hypothetical protein [Brenneria roseae]|uniref:hypothetical protein n=1 Tax=Brenneria roseae TaxID=1509241 RepID=UPI001FF7C1B2|nr:hypothetical protein [Brenneria roseae]
MNLNYHCFHGVINWAMIYITYLQFRSAKKLSHQETRLKSWLFHHQCDGSAVPGWYFGDDGDGAGNSDFGLADTDRAVKGMINVIIKSECLL